MLSVSTTIDVLTCRTFPMMTESTLSAVTPLASNAALFVRTDISVAVRSFILPPNAPNGVLLAATMKAALLTRAAIFVSSHTS